MNSIKLKDVFLGINDGKKEALYREDFEKYFYDYNDLYEDSIKKECFLILGRKGSGKTILAEYIRKLAIGDPCHFIEINSYKDFKFHELVQLKTHDIRPNEYIAIWEWVILLDFARILLKDQSVPNSDTKTRLNKFFKDNYYSIDIDSKKVIELTKSRSITGSLSRLSGQFGSSTTKVTPSYLNYLENLRDTVIELLSQTSNQYDIFYDELDDRFRDNEEYKDSIISLIKATDKLNLLLLEKTGNAKLTILLRSDIFSVLNDPDLNKIRTVNSITIDWGNAAVPNSPLFDLVINKIKTSLPFLKDEDRNKLFTMFFPQKIKGIPPALFLLGRTLFRPRDVITYLNMIIKKYPYTSYFGWKGFHELRCDYSDYFFQEIRNELSGHLSDDEIDKGTLLLKQYNQPFFMYKDLSQYFCKNHPSFTNLNFDKILRTFFKFNIIGNRWFNERKQKYYYSWAYRDNKAEIDLNKEFVIHLGLREELSL